MLSFKPTFSLSTFTFIKGLFGSSPLSAIRVVSSAYLRLLIFLLAILIPDGETVETVSNFIFGAPKSLQMVIEAMKLKDAYTLEEKL